MQKGQTVGLIDTDGTRHQATILGLAGSGASGFKTLDLSYQGTTFESVPHENDAKPGEAFWLEVGARRKEPEPAPEESLPMSLPRKAKKE